MHVPTLSADEVLAQLKHAKQPQDKTNPPIDGCTGRKHRPQQLARLQSVDVSIFPVLGFCFQNVSDVGISSGWLFKIRFSNSGNLKYREG